MTDRNNMIMKVENRKKLVKWLIIILLFGAEFLIMSKQVQADENKYYLGSVVNTGKDNGYSDEHAIEASDPHFGWNLGRFYVNGYTRVVENAGEMDGAPVFLKNAGDTVALWFSLEQDIDCLNEKDTLEIYEDNNGYDQYFGVERTNFGRGTLIVRHIDYQNNFGEPTIYTDFLAANVVEGADKKVELFEEGDYEVALNYEIKNDPRKILGMSILPTYTNYRIFFRFSVRNGNCMVFPFDCETGEELTNASITEHGFYLDLAKSRYLDINIKKEVLENGADGLTEDVRFNRPAKDGDQYTEEGIYTITVENPYTEQETVKKIYVGTNDILKAHVVTGYSISTIQEEIANGAVVAEDGTLILEDGTQVGTKEDTQEGTANQEENKKKEGFWASKGLSILKWFGILFGIWVVYRILITRIRRGRLGL